jgi:predicted dehydrogenase
MQKPMGRNLDEARQIVSLCHEKQLVVAVNFQLRFSPMMLALSDILRRDLIGQIVDVDVHLNYREPWELFPFLKSQPRVEMLIVSIHYFDWLRSILGDPAGVYARSLPHPSFPEIEATRTSAILDYGNQVRCCLSLNNTWSFRSKHEECAIRVEGLKGAAIIRLGCLIGYPTGQPDQLEYVADGGEWTEVALDGCWFPDAFIGTMSNVQRFASGEDQQLLTSIDDAIKTMALVEALYESSRSGATPVKL